MTSHRSLPLFPLNTVLFPGNPIPLQIFEPRYQAMLSDCMASDRRFGVALIKAGAEVGGSAQTHDIGTIARINNVNEVAEGRYFISAVGEQRFAIRERGEDAPYPVAQIEPLSDEAGVTQSKVAELGEAMREGTELLLSLVFGLGGGWTSDLPLPESPADLSYYIPKLLSIGLAEKQRLLEVPTVYERLTAEAELLEDQVNYVRVRVNAELKGRFSAN